MQLTEEQREIIASTGDIKINAVAGSGKTTTVIEYAKARPKTSKILYLAFNRSVRLEAQKKFADQGLSNVTVETAHSLAYRHVVRRYGYKVHPHGYKTHEIAEILGLQGGGSGEKHAEYIVANHINRFIAYFCNSDERRVQSLNYLDLISDSKAKAFVKSAYDYIEKQTRVFLAKMDKGEIDITHDFYLKKFQLSQPQLPYDYILFDEGQDASATMLDVFFRQQATKVIVGDTHQQIYGWRYAINSLEKADFTTYHLSASFRFGQDIANLAMGVLQWKEMLGTATKLQIKGQGTPVTSPPRAILARTNLGLLLRAIEYVSDGKLGKDIYFEGNINSYTYADEGASLYDVLNLFNGQRGRIRDKLIAQMRDMPDLEEYIEQTEDGQLGMMVEIVKEYGNRIPGLIQTIKDRHIEEEDKTQAKMVFSTVHRCKGMEYDAIELVNDFTNEEKLGKLLDEVGLDNLELDKLNEEINLLYVAITRTRGDLHIPETLLPTDFPESERIHVIPVEEEEEEADPWEDLDLAPKPPKRKRREHKVKKEPSVEEKSPRHAANFSPWTPEQDEELTVQYCEGAKIKDMANHFGRSPGAIRARITKLELRDKY
ncbi:MAG TPA: DNA helicase [Cytophagales bacterium]|nr:DNA helicase [Cytophagales bacterium]